MIFGMRSAMSSTRPPRMAVLYKSPAGKVKVATTSHARSAAAPHGRQHSSVTLDGRQHSSVTLDGRQHSSVTLELNFEGRFPILAAPALWAERREEDGFDPVVERHETKGHRENCSGVPARDRSDLVGQAGSRVVRCGP